MDSTRRGKRLPDALSKTIPIWCAVINRAISIRGLSPEHWDAQLHTLPSIISSSEHSQIAALIDEFALNFLVCSNATYFQLSSSNTIRYISLTIFEQRTGVDVEEIYHKLKKPLRPLWFTPQSSFLDIPDYSDSPFLPVICLSASQFVEGGSQARNGYMYVQGSGDDEEAWSMVCD